MNDYVEINNQAAWVDDKGAVFIPLRGNMLDKHQRKEHAKECHLSLPVIDGVSEDEDIIERNRALLAYRQSCCGRWFRPRYDYWTGWEWVLVSKWRLWWWQKKGLL